MVFFNDFIYIIYLDIFYYIKGIDPIVNYGCLPQTWEDPNFIDSRTKCKGFIL